VFVARDVARIAKHAIEDGSTAEEICLALEIEGIDCCGEQMEGCERELARVTERAKALEARLDENRQQLEDYENAEIITEAISFLLTLIPLGLFYNRLSAIYRLWRARNSANETASEIIRRLQASQRDLEGITRDHAARQRELLKMFEEVNQ